MMSLNEDVEFDHFENMCIKGKFNDLLFIQNFVNFVITFNFKNGLFD